MSTPRDIITTTPEMFVRDTTYLKWMGIPFYAAMLCLYSVLTHMFTGAALWITPLSWLVDMLVFYVWHVQAHHLLPWLPLNHSCHNWHNLHHRRFFPAKHFFGSEKATEWIDHWNDEWYLIRHALPLGELPLLEALQNESFGLGVAFLVNWVKYQYIPVPVLLATIVQGLLVNFVGNYLHLSFHRPHHWLNGLELYKDLRYLHFEHHNDSTKRNYAIFFFGFDKACGTYVKQQQQQQS